MSTRIQECQNNLWGSLDCSSNKVQSLALTKLSFDLALSHCACAVLDCEWVGPPSLGGMRGKGPVWHAVSLVDA